MAKNDVNNPCESNCPDGCMDCPNPICQKSILVLNSFSFNEPILIKAQGEGLTVRPFPKN